MQKILLATAACALLSFPAFAQTVEQDGANDSYGLKTGLAEKVFVKYHKAIRAEESCNGRQFSPDQKNAMEETIQQRMSANSPEVSVGAARLLVLRRVADDAMNSTISNEGCDGDHVKKMLAFYDERLAQEGGAVKQTATTAQPADAAPETLTPQGQ